MALPLTYTWRQLFVRRLTTLLTVLVVAAVVATLAWMLGFAEALRKSLAVASDVDKVIVVKRGATAESNSALPIDEFNRLSQVQGLARDARGEPLISPEMLVQVSLPRLRDAGRTNANVAVRGVTDTAFDVHRRVRLVEGRRFGTGEREVIVGRKAAEQFGGLSPGSVVNLGYGSDRGYSVVGLFEADGGPMESEIWGYLPSLLSAYNRTMYSSASLRLASAAGAPAVLAQIDSPAIGLSARTEADYWSEQAGLVRAYLGIAYALVTVMSLAATFSIANTMYASVAGRTGEIAMLRTIGYRGQHILSGFVLEAVMLALIGGVAGCVACWVYLHLAGGTKDMFGRTTFTTMAFDIRLSPLIVATALGLVCLVGALGAWFPARRAASLNVITALREA